MITAQKFEQGVNVSVSNTGEPISPELQAKIWDKFFTTKSKNGTGLGLSIVKRIIDEHGARIALQSEADLTTFQITFLN
jgi:two-component system NtrC family sensor kinase